MNVAREHLLSERTRQRHGGLAEVRACEGLMQLLLYLCA